MKKVLWLVIVHLISFNSFSQIKNLDNLHDLLDNHPTQDSIRVNLLNQLSFLIFKNQPEKSFQYATEALTLSHKLKLPIGELKAKNNLAVYHLMKGRSEIALETVIAATQIAEELRSAALMADCYSILATIYHNQKMLEKATHYLNLALSLKPSNVFVTSRIYNSLGSIARDKQRYDSALIYYEKAIMLMNKANNNYRMPEVLNNIGTTHFRKGEIESAHAYFIKSAEVARKTNNKRAQILAAINLGNILIEKKQFLAGEEIERSALLMAKEMGDQEKILQIYLSLAVIKMETGQHHEAHVLMTKHYGLKDSLQNEEKNLLITELEARYETQKKDNTIRLLEQQAQIHSLQQRFLLIALVAVTFAIGVFYFLQYYHNKRVKKLLHVQKTLNQKLKENDKIKSSFFTNISHEFRTPLTLILSPLEARLSSSSLSAVDREHFELMKRNANRLLTLVNQLLDLSKLEANKMELTVQKADLKKFLSITATSFDSLAESKGIIFKKEIYLDLQETWFDADKLEKIINNVLFNAFKFTPRGGKITYTATQNEKTNDLIISLMDTGVGIPESEQGFLFSPFYQTRNEANYDQHGTGLGLALVKELVRLYKGQIDFASTVNQGTTIVITIPITKERLPSTARLVEKNNLFNLKLAETIDAQIEVTNRGNNAIENIRELNALQDTILIIEDNHELRNFISSRLQDRFTVLTAVNGKEGFAMASESIPDLIVSDIMMPQMDGLELSDRIKNDERTSHIPIVLLTAKADVESRIAGLQRGADDYLAKPFSMEELQVRITNLIEQRKKLAKKYRATIAAPVAQTELSIEEKFLQRAKKIVVDHISDSSFGVEKMAEIINLSRAQLFRKLKAITGISPNEFINEIRLQKAALLIRSKADTIAQIGYSVGFNEQSYFAKSFRKRFGVPPSEYSKKETVEESQICE